MMIMIIFEFRRLHEKVKLVGAKFKAEVGLWLKGRRTRQTPAIYVS